MGFLLVRFLAVLTSVRRVDCKEVRLQVKVIHYVANCILRSWLDTHTYIQIHIYRWEVYIYLHPGCICLQCDVNVLSVRGDVDVSSPLNLGWPLLLPEPIECSGSNAAWLSSKSGYIPEAPQKPHFCWTPFQSPSQGYHYFDLQQGRTILLVFTHTL